MKKSNTANIKGKDLCEAQSILSPKKVLAVLCLLLCSSFAFSCSTGVDTCIHDIRPLKYSPIDSDKVLLQKKAIPNFIQSIKDCRLEFNFDVAYVDLGFEMTIPSYFIWKEFNLVRVSNEFGADYFNFHFYDGIDSLQRSVQVYYDFTGETKREILKDVEEGGKKYTIKKSGDRTIYLFRNFQDKYCGRICLENGVIVGYYTMKDAFVPELEEAILSFRWK